MKEIQNVVIQIAENQHLSEERFVCNFEESGIANNIIVNKISLTNEELAIYEAFINLVNTKVSE